MAQFRRRRINRSALLLATGLALGFDKVEAEAVGGAQGVAVVEVFDPENSPQIDRMGVPGVNVAFA